MIPRTLSKKLKTLARCFQVVAVLGPRQSGKTTLVKKTFPRKKYLSLENPDTREYAANDPRGFLADLPDGAILDEIQRLPELFSYLQGVVDDNKKMGMFILTGSQHFLLQESISQTLAGRIAITTLFPFSLGEIKNTEVACTGCEQIMFTGLFPPIHDRNIDPLDWYPNYVQTYVERDLRHLKNIHDLSAFQKFMKMCAARTGQLLNLSSLGIDCGITHNTAKAWLSLLESSFLIFLLKPHHENFNKRLVKMPKLYFCDTGLLCYLLGIENERQLKNHALKGNLFENLIISELIKSRYNIGRLPAFYFWRDKTGHEIDCLADSGEKLTMIEIKSGKTVVDDFFSGLKYLRRLAGDRADSMFVVYGGEQNQRRSNFEIVSWTTLKRIYRKI